MEGDLRGAMKMEGSGVVEGVGGVGGGVTATGASSRAAKVLARIPRSSAMCRVLERRNGVFAAQRHCCLAS